VSPAKSKIWLGENLLDYFFGHCEAGRERSEGTSRSNLGGEAKRLRCPDKSRLAMTKGEVPDKAGNYKNLEAEYEYDT
jgi:hypothetical protein